MRIPKISFDFLRFSWAKSPKKRKVFKSSCVCAKTFGNSVSPKLLVESTNLCVHLVQEEKTRFCSGKKFEKFLNIFLKLLFVFLKLKM